jgi:hypothetical protein
VSIGLARKRGASYDPPTDRAVLATLEIQVAPSATISETATLGLRDILVTDDTGAPLAVAGIQAEIEIFPEKRGIWPGDANNSGEADPSAVAVTAADLLPSVCASNLKAIRETVRSTSPGSARKRRSSASAAAPTPTRRPPSDPSLTIRFLPTPPETGTTSFRSV